MLQKNRAESKISALIIILQFFLLILIFRSFYIRESLSYLSYEHSQQQYRCIFEKYHSEKNSKKP